ncbi:MAG: flavodoxin family protein [Candidatus Kapabacteria bacterium]|jgi:multimeric flavodoxin WrbA|nr:flavodoxin family protein [Candidatus Kapabacteria bacterium]
MLTVAIVYHSGFGHTTKLAEAATKGAESLAGTTAYCFSTDDIDAAAWQVLNSADAIIFGAPTYMGAVSAGFKDFMDKSGKLWLDQKWKDKIAAGFTTSGSYSGDKLAVLQQLAGFAAQHGMIWISLGLKPGDSPEDGANTHVMNRLGSYLGAMARSTSDSPEVTPPKGDLDTAYYLGRRVAELTQRFKTGTKALADGKASNGTHSNGVHKVAVN